MSGPFRLVYFGNERFGHRIESFDYAGDGSPRARWGSDCILSLLDTKYGHSAGKERWIVVPFSCGDETLKVKVCLTRNRRLPRLDSLGSVRMTHR